VGLGLLSVPFTTVVQDDSVLLLGSLVGHEVPADILCHALGVSLQRVALATTPAVSKT